jgi:MFS family permease
MIDAANERAMYARVARRLLPLLFLGYFMAILDRVNVGFAKLQMADQLGISDAVYGFGAGVFFIGYFLFEVPSNLILARVGARRWLARIMATWGVVTAGFVFLGELRFGPLAPAFGLTDAQFGFYLLRFVLGVAEAGFVPGVILYLTQWFPAGQRSRVMASFFVAIPLASVIGAPVSGALLQFFDGAGSLHGWQWLFVVEGLPSVAIALVILARLPDRPADAAWLSDDERALIARRLAEDEARKAAHGQRHLLREVFSDWRVWALGLADFARGVYANALNFWLPTLVQEIGIDKGDYFRVGLVTAIPWSVGAVAMVAAARSSDRRGERKWHAVGASLLAGAGLLVLGLADGGPVLTIVALAMVAAGSLAWLAVFWTLPTAFLSGAAAAGGIAWINAVSQLSGFVGPDLLGRVRGANQGDTSTAFLILAGFALVVAVLSWVLARQRAAQA